MEGSILTDTKKIIGITEDDTSFDVDIIIHINSVFSILQQLGVGPDGGFEILDKSDLWDDYVQNNKALNMVKTYMYLKTKFIFDPPGTSFLLGAMTKQIEEFETRISIECEWALDPVDPRTLVEEDEDDG